MARYGISIKEILKKTIIVEAENLEQAIYKTENAIEKGIIEFDFDDFDDREIEASKYWDNGKIPEDEDVSFFWSL